MTSTPKDSQERDLAPALVGSLRLPPIGGEELAEAIDRTVYDDEVRSAR